MMHCNMHSKAFMSASMVPHLLIHSPSKKALACIVDDVVEMQCREM